MGGGVSEGGLGGVLSLGFGVFRVCGVRLYGFGEFVLREIEGSVCTDRRYRRYGYGLPGYGLGILCGEKKGAFVRGSSSEIQIWTGKSGQRMEVRTMEGKREMDGLRRLERSGDWRFGLEDVCSEICEEAMCVEDCGRC